MGAGVEGLRCPPGAAGGGPALPLCPGRRGRLTRWWRRPPLPWLRARGGEKPPGAALGGLSPPDRWGLGGGSAAAAWLGWPTDREGGTFHGDSFPPAPGTAGKGLAPPYRGLGEGDPPPGSVRAKPGCGEGGLSGSVADKTFAFLFKWVLGDKRINGIRFICEAASRVPELVTEIKLITAK